MLYCEASSIGKIRAIAAYLGVMPWDGMAESDQDKMFAGAFTEDDGDRLLQGWEDTVESYAKENGYRSTLYDDLTDEYQAMLASGIMPAMPAAAPLTITIENQ